MMLPGQIGWLNLKVGFDFIIIIIVITFDTIYARFACWAYLLDMGTRELMISYTDICIVSILSI